MRCKNAIHSDGRVIAESDRGCDVDVRQPAHVTPVSSPEVAAAISPTAATNFRAGIHPKLASNVDVDRFQHRPFADLGMRSDSKTLQNENAYFREDYAVVSNHDGFPTKG